VTDSIACLTNALITQYDIGIIPINFYAGGKLYRDWVDITPSEAYKLFLNDPDSFKTSAASPEDCLQGFREASKKASKIFCVTVSSKLSMMYHAVCEARELAKTELENVTIEVMDSYSATPSEGMIALAGARAAADGADIRLRKKTGDRDAGRYRTDQVADEGHDEKHAHRHGSLLVLNTICSGVPLNPNAFRSLFSR